MPSLQSCPPILNYTRSGVIPHISPTIVQPENILVSLQHFLPTPPSASLSQLFNGKVTTYLDTRDILSLSNLPLFRNKISVNCKAARNYLTVEDYIKHIEALKPDYVFALSDYLGDDSHTLNCTKKQKSESKLALPARRVDRNLAFLTSLLKATTAKVYAVLDGGLDLKERERHSELLSKVNDEKLVGYVLPLDEEIPDLDAYIQASLKHLPQNKHIIAVNIKSLAQVITCFKHGVKTVENAFLTKISENGQLLNVNLKPATYSLNDLRSETFVEDTSKLSESCDCYVCKTGYSKAYLNHLVKKNEMLYAILLQMHNQRQFELFVADILKNLDNEAVLKTWTEEFRQKDQ